VTLTVMYYETAAGRSQAIEFLAALPVKQRAEIVADIEALRLAGWDAPISCRWIRGHHPMMEIRTGGFRTYCVVRNRVVWILHVGKKQTQQRDIETASTRMKHVLGGQP
jgi:phage-related protein